MHYSFINFAKNSNFSFNFRELRSFRTYYIARNLINSKTNSAIYSFYGNGEAISPNQRRQFRESSINGNISGIDTNEIKIVLFPGKIAKRLYATSSLKTIKSFLKGTTIRITIKNNINIDISKRSKLQTIFQFNKFSTKTIDLITMLERIFKFAINYTVFFSGNQIGPVIRRSYFSWKNKYINFNLMTPENFVFIHSAGIKSLYNIKARIAFSKSSN